MHWRWSCWGQEGGGGRRRLGWDGMGWEGDPGEKEVYILAAGLTARAANIRTTTRTWRLRLVDGGGERGGERVEEDGNLMEPISKTARCRIPFSEQAKRPVIKTGYYPLCPPLLVQIHLGASLLCLPLGSLLRSTDCRKKLFDIYTNKYEYIYI